MGVSVDNVTVLRLGSTGKAVSQLQQLLGKNGCDLGTPDGYFGARTEKALQTFQHRHGLRPDGAAGSQTLSALGAASAIFPTLPEMRSMFPFTQAAAIERHLPAILAALAAGGLAEPRMVLVALATIRAEAESFEPVAEGVSEHNTSAGGHPFDRYDYRPDLGNCGPPDGADFRGRGYVQLTGRANYHHFGAVIGCEDLTHRPNLACDPTIAAQILAAFLHARRSEIEAALDDHDLPRVRRAVNGGTNGLGRFTAAYQAGAGLAGLA